MIYLASPYTDPDPEVMEARFRQACRAAAELMIEGEDVFSPIAHSHPIALYGLPGKQTDCDFWLKYDRAFMDLCDTMVILALPGWTASRGIKFEMEYMKKQGKQINIRYS